LFSPAYEDAIGCYFAAPSVAIDYTLVAVGGPVGNNRNVKSRDRRWIGHLRRKVEIDPSAVFRWASCSMLYLYFYE
jgi:hypothetical protein